MSQHGYPERVSRRDAARAGKPCAEDAGTIEVLVETLTGTAFEMTVSPLDTVLAIKAKIFRVEGIPISQQHLLYNLQELDDASSLQEHCIDDGATLRLVLSMRGGPVSTHRLPPPAPHVHWRECRELEDDRDDAGEWLPAGAKVTVLVFRDGDNAMNMVRVVENEDGTYSPLADTHVKNSSSLRSLMEEMSEEGRPGSLQDNAVTMGKMLELRRRMESVSVRRGVRHLSDDRPPDESDAPLEARGEEATCAAERLPARRAPLYDAGYTRYDYDCAFADRYTLLPPISADSEQSSEESVGERLKLSDALAGSILVKRGEPTDEEAAILEESLCGDECLAPPDKELLSHTPIPAADYGPLVGGETGGWRVRRAFGSSSQLAPPAPLAPAHSASSLHPPRPAHRAPHPHHHPPLSDALFSSSTSDLEKLKRNRLLPALCRHRNRERLDVSDERLDVARPARNLEVGSERRHRRIRKIAELESARAEAPRPSPFGFDDAGYESSIRKLPNDGVSAPAEEGPRAAAPPAEAEETPTVKKLARVRCGLCRKRLSIATVHRCRCGAEFCAPHRYAEVHGCAYDYKAHAHQYLQRANPLVSAPKLPKI